MNLLWGSLIFLEFCTAILFFGGWGPNRINYWQRLKILNLNSIERRNERYAVIYVWKILQGIVHNPGLVFYHHQRRGWLCKIPQISESLREDSFLIRGPKLFNSMPLEIRNKTMQEQSPQSAVDSFKRKLDKFLETIPDRPNLSSQYSEKIGACDIFGKKTNSLVDLVKLPNENYY